MFKYDEKRGFSLIEIVIATILIVLALVPLMSLMIAGHKGTAFSIRQSKASNMAQEIIEAVEGLSYDDIDVDRIKALATYLRPNRESVFAPPIIEVEPERSYAPAIGIVEMDFYGVSNDPTKQTLQHVLIYKIVRVTIKWVNTAGRSSSGSAATAVTFSTVVSKVKIL